MLEREVILRGYRGWNDSVEAWLQMVTPDAAVHMSGLFPDFEPVYRGHAGLSDLWQHMHEAWEQFSIEPEEIFADGDSRYAVAIRFWGRGAKSGLTVDMRFAHAIRLSDGLIAEVISRRTIEEARAALKQFERLDGP